MTGNHRSLPASCQALRTGDSRYSATVRVPSMISALVCMPAALSLGFGFAPPPVLLSAASMRFTFEVDTGATGHVSKHLSRGWLMQREEILAFCQARPHDGGEGALLVLLHNRKKTG